MPRQRSDDSDIGEEAVPAPLGDTHPVPYPNDKDRREYFEKNTHPVPYPKGQKPYDDSY